MQKLRKKLRTMNSQQLPGEIALVKIRTLTIKQKHDKWAEVMWLKLFKQARKWKCKSHSGSKKMI